MGKVYDRLDDRLRAFIEAQHVFFVATAPLDGGGTVNVSPKGYADTFRILADRQVAYLDLTGSGVETVAHVRENGRLTIMFCSFERSPKIVRLQGRARVVTPAEPSWPDSLAGFGDHPGARSIVVLDVDRIADSCGFAVPLYAFEGERDVLDASHERRGPAGIVDYQREHNETSLDGLPALS